MLYSALPHSKCYKQVKGNLISPTSMPAETAKFDSANKQHREHQHTFSIYHWYCTGNIEALFQSYCGLASNNTMHTLISFKRKSVTSDIYKF